MSDVCKSASDLCTYFGFALLLTIIYFCNFLKIKSDQKQNKKQATVFGTYPLISHMTTWH